MPAKLRSRQLRQPRGVCFFHRRATRSLPFLSSLAICSTTPPPPVTVEVNARVVTVTGKLGTITREFKHLKIDMVHQKDARKIRVDLWFANRKQLACIRTICSHIENMVTGVRVGFLYKMKFVYSHFPINVTVTDGAVEIRNFMGEKRVRKIKMLDGVTATRTKDVKDQIEISGIDITKVSLSGKAGESWNHLLSVVLLPCGAVVSPCKPTPSCEKRLRCLIAVRSPFSSALAAAQVQQMTLIRNKDIRKFLDGWCLKHRACLGRALEEWALLTVCALTLACRHLRDKQGAHVRVSAPRCFSGVGGSRLTRLVCRTLLGSPRRTARATILCAGSVAPPVLTAQCRCSEFAAENECARRGGVRWPLARFARV